MSCTGAGVWPVSVPAVFAARADFAGNPSGGALSCAGRMQTPGMNSLLNHMRYKMKLISRKQFLFPCSLPECSCGGVPFRGKGAPRGLRIWHRQGMSLSTMRRARASSSAGRRPDTATPPRISPSFPHTGTPPCTEVMSVSPKSARERCSRTSLS